MLRRIRQLATRIVLICALITPISACVSVPNFQNLAEASDRAVNILDDGIATLGSESADWRTTLEGMVSKLTEDAQSTVRHEITDLMNRSIAAVGTEIKCLVDFVGTRVRQGLISIRSAFLGGTPEETEPIFCDTVPRILEQAQIPSPTNVLEFYGYDFDRSDIRLVLVKSGGSEEDVTDRLDRPTHYHMTLNLGANGVQISPESQRIVVRWQDKEISTIGIIRDAPKICKMFTETVRNPGALTVMPALSAGDREFSANGPRIMIHTKRIRSPRDIAVEMKVWADEVKGDTKAFDVERSVLYTAPPDRIIERVLGDNSDVLSPPFIDGGWEQTELFRGSGGVVDRYLIDGDRKGDDAGVFTKVTAYLNDVKLVLRERGDCISPNDIQVALQRGQLTTKLRDQIRPQLDALPDAIKALPPDGGASS